MVFIEKPSCVGTKTYSGWCGQHSDSRAVNVNLMSTNLFLSLGEENILFSMLCHKDGVIGEEEEKGMSFHKWFSYSHSSLPTYFTEYLTIKKGAII